MNTAGIILTALHGFAFLPERHFAVTWRQTRAANGSSSAWSWGLISQLHNHELRVTVEVNKLECTVTSLEQPTLEEHAFDHKTAFVKVRHCNVEPSRNVKQCGNCSRTSMAGEDSQEAYAFAPMCKRRRIFRIDVPDNRHLVHKLHIFFGLAWSGYSARGSRLLWRRFEALEFTEHVKSILVLFKWGRFEGLEFSRLFPDSTQSVPSRNIAGMLALSTCGRAQLVSQLLVQPASRKRTIVVST